MTTTTKNYPPAAATTMARGDAPFRSGLPAPTRHAVPSPSRWAQRAAALAVLTTLPSGLWRFQRWGEFVPGWVPLLGDKQIPPLGAVAPAGAGAVALTLLWISALFNTGEIWAIYGLDGAERVLMMACYAPLLLWGPLLAAVTVSYHRRHRRASSTR